MAVGVTITDMVGSFGFVQWAGSLGVARTCASLMVVMVVLDLVTVLFFPVVDGGPNGIFCQDGAVNFDRGQSQLLHNFRVLDGKSFINGAAFDPLCGQRRRCNRRSTAKAFEFGVFDFAGLVDLDLELHDVAAFGSANNANANIGAFFDVG